MDAQMFGSSPVGGSESMHLMVLLALTAAHTSIDIENPYFVPDRLTVDALIEARRRGVRVRIVVPGRYIDARIGRWAAQGLYGVLLQRGHRSLRVPADDDPLQGHGHRRRVDLRRIRQL